MASFGETLKRERELRDISLRQISEATKINIRYLEALEENRFDSLPGGLFNKGFIRAYAKFVGIDGEEMVNAYLQDLKGPSRGGESPALNTRTLHRPAEVPLRKAGPPAGAADRGAAERESAGTDRRSPTGDRRSSGAERGSATAERGSAAERGPTAERGPAPSMSVVPPARESSVRSEGTYERQMFLPSKPAPLHPSPDSRLAAVASLLEKPAPGQASATEHSGADAAHHGMPAPSRVLAWVVSLVALGGLLFLIVMLSRRPHHPAVPVDTALPASEGVESAPGSEQQQSSSEQQSTSGQPPTSLQQPTSDQQAPSDQQKPVAPSEDAASVLPGVASQSPLTLGSLSAPEPKGTIAPPAKPKVEKAPPTAKPSPEPSLAAVRSAPESAPMEPSAAALPEAEGPMEIELEARTSTFVVLNCDGREMVNRIFDAGDSVRTRCESVIRVSALDAGAVKLKVNGSTCLPLGDPGTRVFGYTIRIDDYARICAPAGARR